MKWKKLTIGLCSFFLMSVLVLAAVFVRPSEADDPPVLQGEGAGFRYIGGLLDNGDVGIAVRVDLQDAEALNAYIEANTGRSQTLITREETERIWVQVTFTQPFSADEVRRMGDKTSFQVENYLVVGRNSDGVRMTRIQVGAVQDVPKQIDAPTTEGETKWKPWEPAGIMVLQGTVETTGQALGRWLTDERVFLIDTAGAEVRDIVNQRYPDLTADRELLISLPTPFWQLDW